jgi:S1-C subfamily serine protease
MTRSCLRRWLPRAAMILGLCILATAPRAIAQRYRARNGPNSTHRKDSPQVLAAFRTVVATSGLGVVHVRAAALNVALGTIIAADGWVLTAAGELRGPLSCRLTDGREIDARLVGLHRPSGLALLKIEARGLIPVEWGEGQTLSAGSWVAAPSPGGGPLAVGVVSVPARTSGAWPHSEALNARGYLGVQIAPVRDRAEVERVLPGTPAAAAGLRAGDVILAVDERPTLDRADFLSRLAQCPPGEAPVFRVRRAVETRELRAVLSEWKRLARGGPDGRTGRPETVPRTGSPTVLRHDTWLMPSECGGPLVDLSGKAVGITFACSARTQTYALPAESIRGLVPSLMSGEMDPMGADLDLFLSR